MSAIKTNEVLTEQELDGLVQKGLRKVNASKESDLCKYLPGEKDGYMHHFTLKKYRMHEPKKFAALIKNSSLLLRSLHLSKHQLELLGALESAERS